MYSREHKKNGTRRTGNVHTIDYSAGFCAKIKYYVTSLKIYMFKVFSFYFFKPSPTHPRYIHLTFSIRCFVRATRSAAFIMIVHSIDTYTSSW
jgi:hypothetical protein